MDVSHHLCSITYSWGIINASIYICDRNRIGKIFYIFILPLIWEHCVSNQHIGVINRSVWCSTSDRKPRLRHCGNRLLPMRAAMNERASSFCGSVICPYVQQKQISFLAEYALRNICGSSRCNHAISHSRVSRSFTFFLFRSLRLSLSPPLSRRISYRWNADKFSRCIIREKRLKKISRSQKIRHKISKSLDIKRYRCTATFC